MTSSLIKCGTTVLLTVFVSALTACGGGRSQPETKVRVGVTPSATCNAIEARRRLASDPPKFGLLLSSIDVDNFTGTTSAVCNERQIVYSEQAPVFGGQNRRGVFVRLSFPDNIAGAERLLFTGRDAGMLIGVRAILSGGRGKRSASLRAGQAIVTVTVGCAQAGAAFELVPCERPGELDDYLEAVSRDLLPALKKRLA